MDVGEDGDEPVVIGAEARGRALVLAAVLVAADVALVFWTRTFSYGVFLLGVTALGLVVVAVVQARERVVLGADGIEVHGRRPVRHAWADLLEVGWVGGRWWHLIAPFTPGAVGCGLLVRTKGGPYDVPGPNAAARVATLAIFGAAASDRARDQVRAACVRHGVPFSLREERMLDDPAPGSPLRDR